MKCLPLVFSVFLAGCLANEQKQIAKWPIIKALTNHVHFVDGITISNEFFILDMAGVPKYKMECYINAYEESSSDFNYSGSVECRLTSLCGDEQYSTLLANCRDQTRDWQSVGRFLIEDLRDGHGSNKSEIVRTTGLRGMRMVMQIENVITVASQNNQPWGVDRVKELDMTISVVPALEMTSDIADAPVPVKNSSERNTPPLNNP